jgi:hypothetical protein
MDPFHISKEEIDALAAALAETPDLGDVELTRDGDVLVARWTPRPEGVKGPRGRQETAVIYRGKKVAGSAGDQR